MTPGFQKSEPTPETQRIPPIILRDTDKWQTVSKILTQKQGVYTRATTVTDGIKIHFNSIPDFQKAKHIFHEINVQYHTFQLMEDKELKIVVRGLYLSADTEEITEDLTNKGFHPIKVVRMNSKRTNRPMPLFLIVLPRSDKQIYDITNIIGLSIPIENLKASPQVGQCYRCQRFGHSQSHCRAQQKCVKCGSDHRAAECPGIKGTDEPTCANCGGPHVASCRGCPKAPKLRKLSNNTSDPNKSYARAT